VSGASAWWRRATRGGVLAGRAQVTTELVCRRVARDGRWRPSRRRQRAKSGGTADCSWRVWKWPSASRPRSSRRRRSAYGTTSRKEKLWSEGGSRTGQARRNLEATKHDSPAGSSTSVPAVFLWHTCVSRRSSTREQENPRVRGEVGMANPFGSIVLLHGPRHPTTPFPRRSSEQDLDTSRKLENPLIELFSSPILFTAGIHFPRVLLHNQGYPKVCPDLLNLLNAGNSLAGISSLTSCYLFSRTRDLIAML
jgi:hypothetical protein